MKIFTQQDLLDFDHCLCFDDILIRPEYSELESRTTPDISTSLGVGFSVNLSLPIISAPMDSITRSDMLHCMSESGGLGILTRFISEQDEIDLQIQDLRLAKKMGANKIGCAIGVRSNYRENALKLINEGCDVICLDVAHADHKRMYVAAESISSLKNRHQFLLMAGNICTGQAMIRLSNTGVDIVKIGIGPGAVCTTRRITGCGIPQLSAILECYLTRESGSYPVSLVADGGLRTSGDMIKSLWAGADANMIGFMLAGTSSTPDINGGKVYRGMSSRTVHQRKDVVAEGIDISIGHRGSTEEKLDDYAKGIRSGLAMVGAHSLSKLRNAKAVIVSPSTMRESEPVSMDRLL